VAAARKMPANSHPQATTPHPTLLEVLALAATGAPFVEIVAGSISDPEEGILFSAVIRLRGVHVEEGT
jgi:hypothetical protein